jgi:hypothetical protein
MEKLILGDPNSESADLAADNIARLKAPFPVVLLGVKHFEQRRGRIAMESGAELLRRA